MPKKRKRAVSLALSCIFALLFFCEISFGEQQATVAELFKKMTAAPTKEYIEFYHVGRDRRAIETKGTAIKEYTDVRESLLARSVEVRRFSKHIIETSDDWRQQITARIILGWLDHPQLYRDLWDWKIPNFIRWHNPIPFEQEAARHKFLQAGRKAIPIMLELIWKKGQTYWGVLPQLLAEWKENASIPVIAESMTIYYPYDETITALGSFGEEATPYIIDALKKAEMYKSTAFIEALGLTGDEKAVPTLRYHLNESPYLEDREMAAVSLGRLNKFDEVRKSIPKAKPGELGRFLRVLGRDHSKESRKLLYEYARKAESEHDRLAAVIAILKEAMEEDIATLCEIIPQEPHDYTRAGMYLYLSRPNNIQVRGALIKALNDKAKWPRIRAIEGLKYYDDEQTTNAVLAFAKPGNELSRNAIFMLKGRRSPAIAEAAIGLLEDEDSEIQKYAAEALQANPTKKAFGPLVRLLDSEKIQVRLQAVRALAKIADKRAIPVLNEALKKEEDSMVKDGIESGIRELLRHQQKR